MLLFFLNLSAYFYSFLFPPTILGRRMCLGENLARMELVIIFTHLLQRFTISKPDDTPPLSMKGSMGATNSPKPYAIQITERK